MTRGECPSAKSDPGDRGQRGRRPTVGTAPRFLVSGLERHSVELPRHGGHGTFEAFLCKCVRTAPRVPRQRQPRWPPTGGHDPPAGDPGEGVRPPAARPGDRDGAPRPWGHAGTPRRAQPPGPGRGGGCTGCLTAPSQAVHSWVRGVAVPATVTQADSPPLLSWGPLPPTAPLPRPATLPGPPVSSCLSSLMVLGRLEQTPADQDLKQQKQRVAVLEARSQTRGVSGPRPSLPLPAPGARWLPSSATPRSQGLSVSHPPLPPS